MKKIILLCCVFFLTAACATPKEIIIIRHADKWSQQNPGPFLSPKGQLRAEKFVSYYLSHFQKPDFIFTSNPLTNPNNIYTGYSYRPLQTVIPLANQLAYQNPTGFPINAAYANNQYKKLATSLLTHAQYNNKIILICWHHGLADALAKTLGVTQTLEKWRGGDYDQVYVLQYKNGLLTNFQILKNQYPVQSNPTWAELAHR